MSTPPPQRTRRTIFSVIGLSSLGLTPLQADSASSADLQFAQAGNKSNSLAPAAGNAQPVIGGATLANVQALRAFTATGVGHCYLTGHSRLLDGGEGLFIHDPSDTATPDDNGAVIVDGGGRRWRRAQTSRFTPEMFGAVGDGETDDSPALQAAINFVHAHGGGTISLNAATYSCFKVALLPNVNLIGAGTEATILKAGADDMPVLTRQSGQRQGQSGVSHLTVWGYADRNPTQGKVHLVNVGPFDRCTFDDVHVIHAREISLAVVATHASVRNCRISNSYRDGINLSDSTYVSVTDNILEEIGDDAIAVHVSSATRGLFDHSVIVTGNKITKALGIKVLGARQFVVSGNTLRFWSGYGIYIGISPYSGEGLTTKFNGVVSGNALLDGIPLNQLGSKSNTASAIWFDGSATTGNGPTAITTPIGRFNSRSGAFQTPDQWLNLAGPAIPRGPDFSIILADNSIAQTLDAQTQFSNSGFGPLWFSQGQIDPAVPSLIRGVDGITFSGADLLGISIDGNNFYGVRHAVYFTNTGRIQNLVINANTVSRGVTGVFASGTRKATADVVVTNNAFDLDPLLESPNRVQPLSGAWKVLGGDWFGCAFGNWTGAIVSGNVFMNCMGDVAAEGNEIAVKGNHYKWDFVQHKGIGVAQGAAIDNFHYFRNSDPRAPNYASGSGVVEAAALSSSSRIPMAGSFMEGQVVACSPPMPEGTRTLIGWRRITTGAKHRPGADWMSLYAG